MDQSRRCNDSGSPRDFCKTPEMNDIGVNISLHSEIYFPMCKPVLPCPPPPPIPGCIPPVVIVRSELPCRPVPRPDCNPPFVTPMPDCNSPVVVRPRPDCNRPVVRPIPDCPPPVVVRPEPPCRPYPLPRPEPGCWRPMPRPVPECPPPGFDVSFGIGFSFGFDVGVSSSMRADGRTEYDGRPYNYDRYSNPYRPASGVSGASFGWGTRFGDGYVSASSGYRGGSVSWGAGSDFGYGCGSVGWNNYSPGCSGGGRAYVPARLRVVHRGY